MQDETLKQVLKLVTRRCNQLCKKMQSLKSRKITPATVLPDDCETINAAIQALIELKEELGCPGV